MASFDQSTDLGQDIAYGLLRQSPVTLFHRRKLIDETRDSLARHGYQIVELDVALWSDLDAMHSQIATSLDFPGYYGRNFDALRDCLRDVIEHAYGWDLHATGLVMVFRSYDGFLSDHPESAQQLLDVMAGASRDAALVGERLICLVQSDDPHITFAQVGSTPVVWNEEECAVQARHGRSPA